MQDWIQLTVVTTTEAVDIVSELLMECGSEGTIIVDRHDLDMGRRPEGMWDILDDDVAAKMGDEVKAIGYYPRDTSAADNIARVRSRLNEFGHTSVENGIDPGTLEVRIEDMEGRDWSEEWKKNFKVFRLGRHIVVRPGWEKAELGEGDKEIIIDPGMAFGTGTHETTGMCTELIEDYVKPGMSVIDVGTGTGILAIAAAYMGAKGILAIDLDELAVKAATENVAINGFENEIRVQKGDLMKAVDESADVVVANIIADVILMFAEPVRAHINKGGKFICSGISDFRKQSVIDKLNETGYHILEVRDKGEWTAIIADRD